MSDARKKNILFLSPIRATFIVQEIEILSKYYNVEDFIVSWKGAGNIIKNSLRLAYIIFKGGKNTHLIYCSFAGFWSFIAVILGKLYNIPVIIVLNGTESVYIPEFKYGNLGNPILKLVCYISFKLSDILLPVSKSLLLFEDNYNFDDPIKYGLKVHFPNSEFKTRIIYNGLNVDFWTKEINIKRNYLQFITVMDDEQMDRKGFEMIYSFAKEFSQVNMIIAGANGKYCKDCPPNIKFVGKMNQEELRFLYSGSGYYLQLSRYEGFGMALCEAMLCGCIPIVSNVNMLPEIAGNTGFILNKRKFNDLKKLIIDVLSDGSREKMSEYAKKQIINNFSLQKREDEIRNVIDALIRK